MVPIIQYLFHRFRKFFHPEAEHLTTGTTSDCLTCSPKQGEETHKDRHERIYPGATEDRHPDRKEIFAEIQISISRGNRINRRCLRAYNTHHCCSALHQIG